MTDQYSEEEEIEGLDEPKSASGGDYPIDTVLVRNEPRTVHDVLRRIKNKRFIMNPDFQRGFIWDKEKQSRLIESVMMRIPLPVFYLAENDEGRLVVVDGLQRLSTFKAFVGNELKLKLPNNIELNGKKFKDISPKLQNRVEDCNLILYILDSKVPEQARLDMFERVNGGVPLTRQQMRNCLFMGEATNFLREEAKTQVFLRATGKSLHPESMRDREFVNRFCAFQMFSFEEYKGDMDDFLANALRGMNRLDRGELDELKGCFRTGLKNSFEIFGMHAFRKHSPERGESRSVINASLWDVMSTGFSSYSIDLVKNYSRELWSGFYGLMQDDQFNESISRGTGDVRRVHIRFEKFGAMLEEVLGDYPY